MIEVVTIWAPRPDHPKWRNDYLELIRLQRRTAQRWGHRHTVVTDAPPELAPQGCDLWPAELDRELMPAMIDGVIARLSAATPFDLVFVDADVLVARDLEPAFDGAWDLGLTRRLNDRAPINNGAMYVYRRAAQLALAFFQRARAVCGNHWGADQEAISQAAAPVPVRECTELRDGMRLGFLSMRSHNVSAVSKGRRHRSDPFVVHFKGEQAKDWARDYANLYILR